MMVLQHRWPIAAMLCVLLLEAASGAVTPPAETMYADALAKEQAVRTALMPNQPPVTVLKAVRSVVEQYELVVRSYPTSGFCDDALWQAGGLSLDAFDKFRQAQDRDTAVRVLRALASQYPTSKFAKLVPGLLARATSLGEPRVDLARMEAPAAPPQPALVASPRPTLVAPPAPRPAAAAPPPPRPAAATPPPAGASAIAAVRPPVALPAIATIKDIRRAILPDVVRVTIELDAEVKSFHEERLTDPARVFIDLTSTRAAPALVDQTLRFDGDAELVRQIRLGRHPNNTTRVVLEAAGVSSFSIYPLYSPYRLVIDCVRPVTATLPATLPPLAMSRTAAPLSIPRAAASAPALLAPPLLRSRPLAAVTLSLPAPPLPEGAAWLAEAALNPEPIIPIGPVGSAALPIAAAPDPVLPTAPARNITGGLSIARQLGLGVSRIVIDPGHGGHDPGAKGNGMTEAELVLDIALRLEKLLVNVPGVEVVLTRRTDEFVALRERTAIANRAGADLFLSIHANASTSKLAQGVETYFLNRTNDAAAKVVAARENASNDESMAALSDLLKMIELNNKLDESRDLATMTQRAMLDKLKGANKSVRDLGVKQAPFVVLIGAAMPSVLAEISFLTNQQEAKLLRGSAYRERIAEALFNAIRKYQTSLKTTGVVAARPQLSRFQIPGSEHRRPQAGGGTR